MGATTCDQMQVNHTEQANAHSPPLVAPAEAGAQTYSEYATSIEK